jgi:Kef-type K+ transport system membrane component KefB
MTSLQIKNKASIVLYCIPTITLLLNPNISVASQNTPASQPDLVSTVGITIVAAALLTILFNRIKLPALLAYIISGLLIGYFAGGYFGQTLHMIDSVSHIGLVFLLFIIGMEMDVSAVRLLGFRTGLAIALQTPVSIAAFYGLQWSLHHAGYSLPGLGEHPESWIYYAVAASLGSTAVVVKLLGDKFDLGSQAGKITVITLIVEDIWAVMALSYVKSGGGAVESNAALLMIGGGILLTITLILISRYVLPRILANLARSPDLLMLVSLGWCFLCAESFARLGLSAEIGALLAGLTIGRLPEHAEVFSRVSSLKDFFMALFFVALGISLPPPTLTLLIEASILVGILVFSRMLLYSPTLFMAGQGPIVSLVVPINLSQFSVFGLLLMSVGLTNGSLNQHDQMIISYAMLISVTISAFTIAKNYRLAMIMSRILGFQVDKNYEQFQANSTSGHDHAADIIILGYFVNTEAIVRHLEKTYPDFLKKILVIDFNRQKHKRINYPGLRIAYGDFSNPYTLRHYGIKDAKVIVSTINNAFLHGIRNENLIDVIKRLNPAAKIVTTSLSSTQSENLIQRGAYACISTPDESAPAYIQAILTALASFEAESISGSTG